MNHTLIIFKTLFRRIIASTVEDIWLRPISQLTYHEHFSIYLLLCGEYRRNWNSFVLSLSIATICLRKSMKWNFSFGCTIASQRSLASSDAQRNKIWRIVIREGPPPGTTQIRCLRCRSSSPGSTLNYIENNIVVQRTENVTIFGKCGQPAISFIIVSFDVRPI